LLLCLILAPEQPPRPASTQNDKPPAVEPVDNSLAIGFVAGSWTAPILFPLPDEAAMESLAKSDPVAFFRQCLRRYDREVSGYTCVLDKTERLDDKVQPQETIAACFREEPFSALLEWEKNARLAKRSLYVKGQNNDKLLVLPNGRLLSLAGIVTRDPDGPSAKSSSRYPQTEFGIKIGTERTVHDWEAAKDRKALHVEYVGLKKVPECGDPLCYVFHRSHYDKPEQDGIIDATMYIDKETWLQVGSVLKSEDGLVGQYFFRHIKLNPDFKPDTFTRKGLNR
jgi:hypothetical protein